jgi:uncharacterized protein (TIGR00290 family)
MMKEKAIVSWSGGKDSSLALYEAKDEYEVLALLTTVVGEYDRVSMHGVRTSLLELQARSLGYPLEKVCVGPACSNDEYERAMRTAVEKFRHAGVSVVICGDIFLEDVRRYREERLFTVGLRGVFPLWKQNTTELANRFIHLGFRAVLCCVDTHALGPEFSGRRLDHPLLAELPPSVDPCGENGEFHSFVFDGPIFAEPVGYRLGESVLRDNRFCFCDLLPQP